MCRPTCISWKCTLSTSMIEARLLRQSDFCPNLNVNDLHGPWISVHMYSSSPSRLIVFELPWSANTQPGCELIKRCERADPGADITVRCRGVKQNGKHRRIAVMSSAARSTLTAVGGCHQAILLCINILKFGQESLISRQQSPILFRCVWCCWGGKEGAK